jgi:glycosyltransferase involved in cell wall biosynthesis
VTEEAAARHLDRSRPEADITYVGFLLGHGGDALQMLALAEGMQRRGATVKIVVPAVPESVTFAERAESLGVTCERTSSLRVSATGSQQRLVDVIRLLRAIRSPLVHFHTGNSCLPRSVMLALELLRYRRGFVTLQSPYETIVPGSSRARFWAVTASRRFEAVISPSDHGSRFQVRCGVPASSAVTVRNSIDVARWAGGDQRGPRQQLGVAADDPLVVFSSRIDGQKRPVDAVRIFAGVATEFPRARLVFVGDGALRQAVVDEAEQLGLTDRVDLVGYQTNVEDWVAAATVWILPTERENFSLAVLEALAAGRAVLSTSCPGNDEVLVDRENAAVFAVGDVDGGIRRLRELLADQDLRGQLGSRAAETAAQFSSDAMVEAYRSVYLRSMIAPERLHRGS